MQREVKAKQPLYRHSSTVGALMFAVALGQMLAIAPRACGGLPHAYDIVVAFELARTPGDLLAIFGGGASECRQALVSSLSILTWLDTLLFVPVYAAFLWCFMREQRATKQRLAGLATSLVLVAAAADWVENACLLALLRELSESSSVIAGLPWVVLPWATGAKWLSLGVCNLVGSLLVWQGSARGIGGLLALVVGSLSLVVVVLAIATPARFGPLLALAVSAGWLLFLGVGIARSIRERALA